MPTHNKAFGISGGAGSQKHLCKITGLPPVRTFVFPPPTPSAGPLVTS